MEAPVERVPGGHDRRRADPLPAPALTDIRPAQGRLDGPRLAGELTKVSVTVSFEEQCKCNIRIRSS